MRRPLLGFVILLACGCGGEATTQRSAPPLFHAVSAIAVEAPAIRARVAVADGGGSWMEVVVAAVDDRARALCEAIVANEVAQVRRVPGLASPVVTACTTARLPRAPGVDPVLLVTIEPQTELDNTLESTLHGSRPPAPPDGPVPTAKVTRVMPFADLATCDVIRARITAENAKARAESQQAVATFIAGERTEAIARKDQACRIDPAQVTRCKQQHPKDRMLCDFEVEQRRRNCDEATERLGILEREAQRPTDPPIAPGRCLQR